MSEETHEEPRVLVLHRRELCDVCEVLDELGVPYEERPTAVHPGASAGAWRVVIATPQRILELQASSGSADGSTLIAVCEGFSKTLAAKLSQARVDFVLRRPVHPGALRLLLLHTLYRGPEKRRFRRVSIGSPVRVRLGWRGRAAMLLELSTTGCRVQIDRTAGAGARVSVVLPAELTGRRALRLRGRVIRTLAAAADDPLAHHEIALQFDTLGQAAFEVVSGLVREYGRGPAAWKDAPRPARAERTASADDSWDGLYERRNPDEPDRRRSPRLRYAKPVLIKGEGASRVLMGSDLSTGGMRVTRDPNLSVGDELKIALYGEDGIPPLMLTATVAREDGRFMMLRFADPGGAGIDQLHRLMSSLPLSGSDDAGQATPLVVSEIVEQG